MMHIHEYLYDKDQSGVHLVDVIQETMEPLSNLCRELNKKSEDGDDMALVIEALLERGFKMQEQILKYIESKTGTINIIMNESENPWLFRTSMRVTGLEINGKHITPLDGGRN